jgi:hypothetical protein
LPELTPDQIMKQLIKSGKLLQDKNTEYKDLARQNHEAEKKYRVMAAQTALKLKVGGMNITLIPDLVKGDTEVAQAKMEWGIAESLYDACREKIKDLRAEIDIMRSLLTWEREEYRNSNIG